MPVTIQLSDELAADLERGAAARRVSLQEFTLRILDGARDEIKEADEWAGNNRRRLDLIRKSCTAGLSEVESAELQELQNALDQRLEPADERLLAGLNQFRAALNSLEIDSKG